MRYTSTERLTGRRARAGGYVPGLSADAQRDLGELQSVYHQEVAAREKKKLIGMAVAAGGVTMVWLFYVLSKKKEERDEARYDR